MARSPVLLGGLLGLLLLAAGLAAVALLRPLGHGPVYTVAQVRAQLDRDPAAWRGQALWVRGLIAGCPGLLAPYVRAECRGREGYYLTDAAVPATEPLPLERGSPAPLLAALRRLPPLGRLLPAPQALRWGADAAYRVWLRPAPADRCYHSPPCYAVVLLDAAPLPSSPARRGGLVPSTG
jgi:hypothetical protein